MIDVRFPRGSGGTTLLEVMVALTILSTLGVTAMWSTSESIRSVYRAHEDEAQMRQANRLMTSVSLWPEQDLDRHLGITEQGPFFLTVQRPKPLVYRVAIVEPQDTAREGASGEADASSRGEGRLLLHTVLYNPRR